MKPLRHLVKAPQGFTTLLSAGLIAHAIAFAAMPILGRIYSPENFGLFGTVMAVVSMAVIVVHGRFHLAIPLVSDDTSAAELMFLSFALCFLLSAPTVFICVLFLGSAPSEISSQIFILTAALLTILSALLEIIVYWRSRMGRFKESARDSLIRVVGTVCTQIVLGPIGGIGLIIGVAFGLLSSLIAGSYSILRRDKHLFRRPAVNSLKKAFIQYKRYPTLAVPQGLVAAFSWNILPLMLFRYEGAEFAGLYWMAYRIYMAPLALFNSAYRQTALPLYRKTAITERRKLVRLHTRLIYLIGTTPVLLLFAFGATLFEGLLGEAWSPAGSIAGWLAIAVLADFGKIPALSYLQSLNKQGAILRWEILILGVRYCVAIPMLIMGAPDYAIAAFSVLGCLGWAAFSFVNLLARDVAGA